MTASNIEKYYKVNQVEFKLFSQILCQLVSDRMLHRDR